LGANPLRLIGLASLNSTKLRSSLCGCFAAQATHVLALGNAWSLAVAIGLRQ
jgi:hypothetical protein